MAWQPVPVLECVINISEGRDGTVIGAIASTAGADLLDVHTDPDHHRSVLTVVGEDAARAVATACIERLDLTQHEGVHPRIGVIDVVPFVPLGAAPMADAVAARDRFACWAAEVHGLPAFTYGEERTLPEIRRHCFDSLAPQFGPATAHRTAGAVAVGARPLLVAYNVWLAASGISTARRIAREIRRPGLRTLGLQVGDAVQVSMNLTDPTHLGPDTATDLVAERAAVERCELVGLVPEQVLNSIPARRWAELAVGSDVTIEARLMARR